MITLKAFGPLDVRDASGRPLAALLSQSKRSALLAYLVLAHPDELYRRDHLLGLFWPELDQRHGRNALSQSLSFLRRELGEGVLVTRGAEEIGVDPAAITSDVRAFEEAVAAEDWSAALEAYGGDLLEGLHVTGAAPFTDWVDRERERLREAASAAAWRLAHGRIEAGELTEAERVAQRALVLVPTDESRVRAFIEALAGAGDRAAALRFYERFREVLAQELEVEPAPETVAVMEAVRDRSEAVEVPTGATSWGWHREGMTSERLVHPLRTIPRRRQWATRGWLLAMALVVGGYVLRARDGGTAGPGTLIGEGIAAKYDEVVVADLSAPFDPGLGATASELLRAALDQSDIVRPVAAPALGAALRRMQRDPTLPFDPEAAREVATRDGYPLVVSGEIEDVGTTYLLTVRLELPTGDVLARFNGAASESEVIRELDRIGGEIRARIGDSRRAIRRSPSLEQVTTPSLEALRLYTEATRLRDWEGRARDAIPLLERAIERDTTFASAYLKLAVTLRGLLLQRQREVELTRRAYRYGDRLSDFERLRVEALHTFEVTPPQANTCEYFYPPLRLYEAYVRRHPEDPRPLNNYGYFLNRVGRHEDAMNAWRRELTLGESGPMTASNLFVTQLRTGDRAAAVETLGEWQERFGESPMLLHAVAMLAYSTGDHAGADSVFGLQVSRFGPDPDALFDLARIDALRGRFREATQHAHEARRLEELQGNADAVVDLVVELALMRLVAHRDTTMALREVSAALAAFPSPVLSEFTGVDVGLFFALAGSMSRAGQVLDTMPVWTESWSAEGLVRAAIATEAGEPERSLAFLDEADIGCTVEPFDPRFFPLLRARAHEAAGRPDSAIANYSAFLAAYPTLDWDAVFLFDTLERLGRLYDARDDRAKAASTYTRAADLWRDADPELQPRVQRLRERAAALRGGGTSASLGTAASRPPPTASRRTGGLTP